MTDLLPAEVDALILALEWPNCLDDVPEWAVKSSSDSAFGRGPGGQSISCRLSVPGRLLAQAYKRIRELENHVATVYTDEYASFIAVSREIDSLRAELEAVKRERDGLRSEVERLKRHPPSQAAQIRALLYAEKCDSD